MEVFCNILASINRDKTPNILTLSTTIYLEPCNKLDSINLDKIGDMLTLLCNSSKLGLLGLYGILIVK